MKFSGVELMTFNMSLADLPLLLNHRLIDIIIAHISSVSFTENH